jgi:hypothetical protein
MHEWEYTKIDLNDLPRKAKDIDLLNDAGAKGWEVVTITSNAIAYLKRQVGRPPVSGHARSPRTKVAQTVSGGVAGT